MSFEVYDRIEFLKKHTDLVYPTIDKIVYGTGFPWAMQKTNPPLNESLIFDNIAEGCTYNTSPYNLMYWRSTKGTPDTYDYYILTLPSGVFDIYRCGPESYQNEAAPLTILKLNKETNETVDVTSQYSQERDDMPQIKNDKVMLSFKNIPGGTYVFYVDKGESTLKSRLDNEWYIIKSSEVKKLIIIKNSIFIPDNNMNLIKIGETPLSKNHFDKINNDNTSLFTPAFLNTINEPYRIGKMVQDIIL